VAERSWLGRNYHVLYIFHILAACFFSIWFVTGLETTPFWQVVIYLAMAPSLSLVPVPFFTIYEDRRK